MQVEWCTVLLLELDCRMLSLKYNSILTRYAILTTTLTFSMITNPGTCVLLNDDVNCKEYIVLLVDD
jgi:hypothetical protein